MERPAGKVGCVVFDFRVMAIRQSRYTFTVEAGIHHTWSCGLIRNPWAGHQDHRRPDRTSGRKRCVCEKPSGKVNVTWYVAHRRMPPCELRST
jgi:hypothetical protein